MKSLHLLQATARGFLIVFALSIHDFFEGDELLLLLMSALMSTVQGSASACRGTPPTPSS